MPMVRSSKTATPGRWESRARERLREAGYQTGGARDAVVGLLARQSCALSAREVREHLAKGGRRVGTASVYRALDTLLEIGAVQRTDLAEGPSRYEPVEPGGHHHHHAVCERCGALTPFEDDGLEAALERISKRLPHAVSSHDVVIRGRCERCS